MPDAYMPMEETGLPEARLEVGEFRNHPKVLAAYDLARLLHRDQKYGDEPYIFHVVGVANIVYRESVARGQAVDKEKLADELCAALLHDSIEDRPDIINREVIQRAFGKRVADIVEFCTDRFKEGQPATKEEIAQISSDNIVAFYKKREEQNAPEAQEAKPRKKDGMVGEGWLSRKQDYLTKLAYAATDDKWKGRKEELESAVTICCADKLMNMQRTNRRLEYAIAHGSEAEPLIHQFWASFNSAQMARPQYDFLLANAFEQVRRGLGDVAEGRFSSLVSQFSGEVEAMHGMMTDLKGTKEQFPRFQQKILQERGDFSELRVTSR